MGAAIDEAFKERLAVTLIAARKSAEPEPLGEGGAAGSGEELAAQLLPQSSTARRGSW